MQREPWRAHRIHKRPTDESRHGRPCLAGDGVAPSSSERLTSCFGTAPAQLPSYPPSASREKCGMPPPLPEVRSRPSSRPSTSSSFLHLFDISLQSSLRAYDQRLSLLRFSSHSLAHTRFPDKIFRPFAAVASYPHHLSRHLLHTLQRFHKEDLYSTTGHRLNINTAALLP